MSDDMVDKYILSTNNHLGNLNSPSPKGKLINKNESPDTKQLIDNFESLSIKGDLKFNATNQNSPKSNTVSTDDCFPLQSTKEPSQRLQSGRYIINKDFNEKSPERNQESVTKEEPLNLWVPDVLRDQHWPDPELSSRSSQYTTTYQSTKIGATSSVVTSANPYLSFSAGSSTMIQNDISDAKNEAEWRKYQSSKFNQQLKLSNVKLAPLDDSQLFVPDTFANKQKPRNKSTESFVPSSPLKLFGSKQDTYTTQKFTDIMSRLEHNDPYNAQNGNQEAGNNVEDDGDERIHNLVRDSDAVFDNLINKNQNIMNGTRLTNNDSSLTYSEDLTSDTDAFSASKHNKDVNGTTDAFVEQGEYLFDNLKAKMGHAIAKDANLVDDSDYMTEDSENDDDSLNKYTQYEDDESESYGTNANSPTPSSSNPDVTASLSLLKQQLNLNSAKKKDVSKTVSTPKIVGPGFSETPKPVSEKKAKGLMFIPGEKYKDKVFDKKLQRYVSIESKMPAQSSLEHGQADDTEIMYEFDALDQISDLNETEDKSSGILRKSFIGNDYRKQSNEVSFKLPNDHHHSNLQPDESIGVDRDDSQLDLTQDLSFSQSNKVLVSAITETYPSADWNLIEKLDISDKVLDKLRDLDKFTPAVRYLEASNNSISHSDGIPSTIQVLKLNNNQFSSLSSFDFADLHILKLDFNFIENLNCLANLYNLTKLSLVGNKVTNLDGLRKLKMLTSLDLSDNKLKGKLDFRDYDLEFLQDLKLDDNKLVSIQGVETLRGLVSLSADRNCITSFTCDSTSNSLKSLSLISNNLSFLDVSNISTLRILKVDSNPLSQLHGLSWQIEKVNMRSQPNSVLVNQIIEESSKSKKFTSLNLTGGSLSFLSFHYDSQFSNVRRLNISAMNLETLPANFSAVFPLLEILNLNFNKLKDLHGLEGLRFLRELTLLSNSLSDVRSIATNSRSFRKTLKLIDLRVNPVNKGFYPYVFYDSDGAVGMDMSDAEIIDEATTLNLRDYEDIEAFSVEFSKLYEEHSLKHWDDKNARFVKQSLVGNQQMMKGKKVYERGLIVWFENINYLDGLRIDSNRRLRERELYTRENGL
ncbi:hypothetical protein CANARDRAFT_29760 [[Candida] arabinofermentans NRRL YB-2248]|uniref:Septation initiation network scaffold protein cdc11 n=1 Tax=[Candida] arabinofermentans NRRL YB-2248 TaxID=983967 RepID=A0A1E4SW91_9ASCO|nr:hypothetical protein CANARDRAFT_29760 [[Candida] arabinofermentans NRRL YB-2248]